MDKELGSLLNSIWEDLAEWDKDDIPINRIRAKFKRLEVRVSDLK